MFWVSDPVLSCGFGFCLLISAWVVVHFQSLFPGWCFLVLLFIWLPVCPVLQHAQMLGWRSGAFTESLHLLVWKQTFFCCLTQFGPNFSSQPDGLIFDSGTSWSFSLSFFLKICGLSLRVDIKTFYTHIFSSAKTCVATEVQRGKCVAVFLEPL